MNAQKIDTYVYSYHIYNSFARTIIIMPINYYYAITPIWIWSQKWSSWSCFISYYRQSSRCTRTQFSRSSNKYSTIYKNLIYERNLRAIKSYVYLIINFMVVVYLVLTIKVHLLKRIDSYNVISG